MTYKCKECKSEWHNFWIFSGCPNCGGEVRQIETTGKEQSPSRDTKKQKQKRNGN